jgi:hypothetical protein
VRSTIDIADYVFLSVKEIAAQRKTGVGSVVSNLLREALQPKPAERKYRNGVPLLPRRPHSPGITTELVNRLRDGDE